MMDPTGRQVYQVLDGRDKEGGFDPGEDETLKAVEGSSHRTLAGDREPGGGSELPSIEVLWLMTLSLAGVDAGDSGLGRLSSAMAHG
jgi:hypothetical protein